MKKNYRIKKTLSIKQFISELGGDFTEHTKKRIMDLWPRCVLTRDSDKYILDLKHVEHIKHVCPKGKGKKKKEYVYGQLIIDEGNLYYSKDCIEDESTMKIPIVNTIYDSLSSVDMYYGDGIEAKKIDDNNIDSIINNILYVCPPMSEKHLEIISKYWDVDDFNNKEYRITDEPINEEANIL
ncbi:MAG: hypothetical protein M0P77_09470 [Firmicutes bacterium]|nr:hypothetical protein [Bacillota bacterium]